MTGHMSQSHLDLPQIGVAIADAIRAQTGRPIARMQVAMAAGEWIEVTVVLGADGALDVAIRDPLAVTEPGGGA